MKSRPLAPSPVKQRWMLLMNFLNKKPLFSSISSIMAKETPFSSQWSWSLETHLDWFQLYAKGNIIFIGLKIFIIFISVIIMVIRVTFIVFIMIIGTVIWIRIIGVTFGLISSCRRREPIVCLALMLCLLQTRPVCWSKGWWLQMMAIWWFSGIRWRGRMNATVVVTFVKCCIGRCWRANWGWSLFPCGKYLFVMTHLFPRTGH